MKTATVLLAVLLASASAGRPAEPGGGQPEGIKVHGHWTIEVRNADGTLESRREVENALVVWEAGGSSLLAGLLANFYSDPIWFVSLYGPDTTGPCQHEGSPGVPWPCHITESRSPFSGTEYSRNLVIGLPRQPSQQQRPLGTLELSGSATAARDATLVRVSSSWFVQARNHFGDFTAKDLTPGIPLRAGQIVQVKVVFSFS
jgi:hypothetical protein